MENFIISFHYLIIAITVFLFIAIIGYLKENKKLGEVASTNNVKDDVSVSTVSIAELDNNVSNNIENLNS